MAKYYLNKTNKVHCRILDENCIADTYTIKFDNGVIRNVSKSKVTDLDKLDEGILDRLKEVGSSLLDNLVKVGHYVLAKINGVFCKTLFNTMFAAEEKPNMQFIPGKTFIEVCEKSGIEATVTEDDSVYEEDEEFLDDLNNIWAARIQQYQEENGELDESVKTYKVSSYASRVLSRLNEAEEIKLEAPEGGFPNVSVENLQKQIIAQYNQFITKGAGKKGGQNPIPFCVWGAPGIGKTQIINSLISNFREQGFDCNMISVNAMTMRKDDFALPAVKTLSKKVKLANGEEKVVDVQKAVELIKSWLPSYDPDDLEEGVTEDIQDDIMNGGDGTGNGKGGFIFIDELSRIDKNVMDVIMKLVQDRELGGERVGSKWMFIAAANRISDMGIHGEDVTWEPAWTGRFRHVNLVPTFEDWLDWAQHKRKSGKPNVHPWIVQFLKEHPNFWYNALAANETGDEITDSLYPTARGWEIITKGMYELEDALNDAGSEEDNADSYFMKMAEKATGIKFTSNSRKKLNPEEIYQLALQSVGKKAADSLKAWLEFDAFYTNAEAKQVWTKGAAAPMNFRINSSTIEKAIVKILGNHPKYKGKKSDNIDITSKEMENVMSWLIEAAHKLDRGTGDIYTQALYAGFKVLSEYLYKAPFRINISSSEARQKYADALMMYNEEINSTKNTIEDAY